jgi:hypothetical protein
MDSIEVVAKILTEGAPGARRTLFAGHRRGWAYLYLRAVADPAGRHGFAR